MKFFFTFGQAHRHKLGPVILDKDSVLVVDAPDEAKARALVSDIIGIRWAFTYTEQRMNMDYFPRGVVLKIEIVEDES